PVYDMRHWKMAILVVVVIMPVVVVSRGLSGRNMWGGGRSTDATFIGRARENRKDWWNDHRGAVRAAVRLAVVVVLFGWFVVPVVVYVLLGIEGVVAIAWGVRKYHDKKHEKEVLRPVWPAVAGIIGIPETQPPTRWLDIPRHVHSDPDEDDAMITVGLRAADAEDEGRVTALVQLFDQRYRTRHYGWVDYAARLVHIAPRPPEPKIWPAVANVLGLEQSELARDWLLLPDDPSVPGAQITVNLPTDMWDHDPTQKNLARLVDQNFAGEWSSTVKHAVEHDDPSQRQHKRVVLTHKEPPRSPPQSVDFLAEHPEYQEMN